MQGIKRGSLLWIAAAFLLCGVLHVLFYRVQYAWNFAEIYCGCVCVFWALSVRKRVTDRRLRRLLLLIAGLLLVYELLQVCRFTLFPSSPAELDHLLWYAYYLPKTALPLLCLALALGVHRPENEPLPRWFRLLLLAAGLMAVGVLTNDLHQCFVSFPGAWTDDGTEKNGWLYYLINALIFGSYFAAFLLLLRKSRVFRGQRLRWLPLIPLGAGLLYFALYALNLGKRVFGVRVWNAGEVLVFLLVGALECCIQTGMIPANTDYEKLFALAKLPAAILDGDGKLCYATLGAEGALRETEGRELRRHPIHGGRVEWFVDVAPLLALNRELREAAQRIENRNSYLAAETRVRAEKAEVETRNRIYEAVVRAIRPQSEQIDALLEDRSAPYEQRLRRVAVLSAYIKRRCNMELLAESGSLPVRELQLAASESMSCLRLLEVETAVSLEGEGELPAPMVIAAYEDLETVIEDCMDSLDALMVFCSAAPGRLDARLLLRSAALTLNPGQLSPGDGSFVRRLSVTKDGQDLILAFSYTEGGGDL